MCGVSPFRITKKQLWKPIWKRPTQRELITDNDQADDADMAADDDDDDDSSLKFS